MKWVRKGAYIRQVDDATAEKLKAQGFVPFEPEKAKAPKGGKAKTDEGKKSDDEGKKSDDNANKGDEGNKSDE